MKSRWLLAVVAPIAILICNSCSSSSSVPSRASLMWVATQGDQLVRTFTISQQNGSVSPVGTNGSPVATGVQPMQMVITPDGKSMFIVNSGTNGAGSVTGYTFKANGSLRAAGSGAAAGVTPVALAVDPAGKFLFVANQGTSTDVTSGTISVFSISGTTLTSVGTFPTETPSDVNGTGPSAVAVSPNGNYLYVANEFSNTVESFSYDSSSGALSFINSYAAGTNPTGLGFSRCAGITSSTATGSCPAADGNHLFVANSGSNNITIFAACIQVQTCFAGQSSPDGTLTPISGSPVAAGVGPAAILVDPTSDFVYAVDRGSSQVSAYQYSPATGALSSLGSGSGGASVFSGGITQNVSNSSTTFNWVVVTNNGSSSLSIFKVAATGKLIGLTSGQFAVQGQPSAILLR